MPPSASTIRSTRLGGALAHLPAGSPSVAGKSIPLMRVWAVNGTITAPGTDGSARP